MCKVEGLIQNLFWKVFENFPRNSYMPTHKYASPKEKNLSREVELSQFSYPTHSLIESCTHERIETTKFLIHPNFGIQTWS
jgi:hypothetical protein